MAGGYRNKSSYVSDDPDKRERQLANLKRGRTKDTVRAIRTPENDPFDPKYSNGIISYLETFYHIPETKQPVILEYWQKDLKPKPGEAISYG